jgi:hypothetical protein
MADKIYAKLIDHGGQRGRTSFPASASAAQIDTFLSAYSLAGCTGGVKIEEQSITTTAPDSPSNVDYQCVLSIFLGRAKTRYAIPACKIPGAIGRRGRELTTAELASVLAAWKTAQGVTAAYTLRSGRFKQGI